MVLSDLFPFRYRAIYLGIFARIADGDEYPHNHPYPCCNDREQQMENMAGLFLFREHDRHLLVRIWDGGALARYRRRRSDGGSAPGAGRGFVRNLFIAIRAVNQGHMCDPLLVFVLLLILPYMKN